MSTRRPDIQGLRAIAVGLVVVFHAFPAVLTGGYVGVDVFFVISGFLITGLLLREVADTGRVSLARFYARRVRRILPAALVATLVTLAASAVIVGPAELVRALKDAAWATVSLANIHFSQGDGYFTQGDPSPFLHYWSLSVEEQFYLVWPIALLGLALIPRGRILLPIVLAVAIGGSLVASIILTNSHDPAAYFSLTTRAWELGVGAILAWVTSRGIVARGRTASALPVVGIVMIGSAAILFNSATPFPGWVAVLPVMGSALVIWGAGGPVARVLSLRPFTYLGDISYSLYLWHWPVLLLGSMVLGTTALAELALIGVAVGFAAISYRFVEMPVQRIRRSARTGIVVAAGLSAVLVVSGCSALASANVPTTSPHTVSVAPSPTATVQGPGPVPSFVPANVTPPISDLLNDLAPVFTNGCFQGQHAMCSIGDGRTSIVLAGDSHAGMWSPAFASVADANGWTVHVVGHNGCPIVRVPISQGDGPEPWPDCDLWQQGAIAEVAALHPALIVLDDNTTGYMTKASLLGHFEATWKPALEQTVRQLEAIAPVLFIGQLPTFPTQPVDCLDRHINDVPACSIPVSEAVPPLVTKMNERVATETGVRYLEPTGFLCTDTCPMMAYNLILYRDASHLDATYAQQLGPLMAQQVNAVLSGHGGD